MADGFDYEAYEKACEVRRQENEKYLAEFEQWLMASGISNKTIQNHKSNVEFYLNTYLLREDAHGMEDGCSADLLDEFMGYFFVRKCAWSTPATIKQNATSFKKFYKCMLETGHIKQESYDALLATIKEYMPDWIAECEDFNNVGPSNEDLLDLFGGGSGGLLDAVYDAVAQHLGLDGLMAPGGADDIDEDYELPTRQDAINELTLALFYLTSWEEELVKGSGITQRRAWKSANWDALDTLREEGLIDCTNEAKSVHLTDFGLMQAETTLEALGLEHLIYEDDEGKDEGLGKTDGKGWTVVK